MPAWADMGKPPVSQGTYVSGEGGYLRQDLEGVNGHGVRPLGAGVGDIIVSPEDGWFAGGMIGFSNGLPLVSGVPFNRIEAYLLFGRTDASAADASPPLADITLKSVDGLTNVIGGASGATTVERRTTEGGFRLEGDQNLAPNTSLTWSLAPFIRLMDEDTDTLVTGCCLLHRNGSVETWLYGATIAVEPELWITPGIALVGRLGGGIYGFNADGDFRSFSTGLPPPDPFAAAATDGDSGVGFRGQLGVGLKFKLFPQGLLETFAEADYFSDVGTAVFSNSIPGDLTPSHVRSKDMWELRAGARVTIGFGATN
jgi:hypothetical protein